MYIQSLIPWNWSRQLPLYFKQDTVQKQSGFQAFQFYFRPDYISPLDDLAFDMYQDPEIAQIIRKLERKKQEAVLRMFMLFYKSIIFLHECDSPLSLLAATFVICW